MRGIVEEVAQAVDAVVAATVGDQQRLFVLHAHEAGRVAARRAVETVGAAGRHREKRRRFDEGAVMPVDVVDLLDQRRPERLVVERLELLRAW